MLKWVTEYISADVTTGLGPPSNFYVWQNRTRGNERGPHKSFLGGSLHFSLRTSQAGSRQSTGWFRTLGRIWPMCGLDLL